MQAKMRLFQLALVLIPCFTSIVAHESCCQHKKMQEEKARGLEWVDEKHDHAEDHAEHHAEHHHHDDHKQNEEHSCNHDHGHQDHFGEHHHDDHHDHHGGESYESRQLLQSKDEHEEDGHDHSTCSHGHHHHHGQDHEHGNSATYISKLYSQIFEAIPWVTLGVLLTAMLAILPLSTDSIKSILSYDQDASTASRIVSLMKSALVGLATPLCSCGALPIASSLASQGVPLASVVSFLTASQSAGLDSAAITWGLLGSQAAVCRLLGAVVLSIATGLSLLSFSTKRQASSTKDKLAAKDTSAQDESSNTVVTFIKTCVETAGDVYPTVLFGLALSTAVVHHLPALATSYTSLRDPSAMESQISEAVLRVAVLFSALPLQLCEHSTVAFAAAIQKAGGSPGLAFAFLMAAPATNLASLLLLLQTSEHKNQEKQTLRWTVLPRVALALVGSALFLSYVVDAAGIDLLVEQEANSGGGSSMTDLPEWYLENAQYLCLALFVLGMGNRAYNAIFHKHDHSDCPCPGDDEGAKNACSSNKTKDE